MNSIVVSLISITLLLSLLGLLFDRWWRSRWTNRHPYAHDPTLEMLEDRSLFFNHNFCSIRYRDGAVLSAVRYENRLLFYENQTRFRCGVCQTPLGDLPDLIRNYVVINNSETKQRHIITIPRIPGMHLKASTLVQAEDPRLFWDIKADRLYMTATVLTQTSVKMALFYLNPNTLQCTGGVILGSAAEIGAQLWAEPQKNWVLFLNRRGQTCVLTHAAPTWRVWRIDLPSGRMHSPTSWDATLFWQPIVNYFITNGSPTLLVRCSSPPTRWTSHSLICALHTREDTEERAPRYRTVFVEFSDYLPYRPLRYSRVHTFTGDTCRVEFSSGFYPGEFGKWNLCLGIDDSSNLVVEMDREDVFS